MSHFDIPSRETLIKRLTRTNRRARILLLVEALVTLILVFTYLDWEVISYQYVNTLIVIGMIGLPTLLSLGRIIAQRKLSLDDVEPNKVIGKYTVGQLRELVQLAEKRLGLPERTVKAFVTREKDLNASAIKIGLAKILPFLNAVYINRPALHVLEPDELVGVIGHEIAHNEKHFLVWDRYLLGHLCFQVVAGLVARQLFLGHMPWELLAPLLLTGAFEYCSAAYHRAFFHTLEYLCDDAGAIVSGIDSAIRGELKIAKRSEAHSQVLYHALRRKLEDKVLLSVSETLHELEELLPFEQIDEATVKALLDERLALIDNTRSELSLRGLLNYLGVFESWDAREQLKAGLARFEALKKIPKLSWDLNSSTLEELIAAIVREPNSLLFHCESDILAHGSTHPTPRQRIVYLWNNRTGIESLRVL